MEWKISDEATPRRIFVTAAVMAHLKADDPYFPRAQAAIVMARFCSGDAVSVSRRKDPKADLKRLVDVDEIWALAFRKPKSGGQGRILGRFGDQDLFVGLGIHLRDDLTGDKYEIEAKAAGALWEVQGPFKHFVSDALGDYIGGDFRNMDEVEND